MFLSEEETADVADMRSRRLAAFGEADHWSSSSNAVLAATANGITRDDVERVAEIVRGLPDDIQALIDLVCDIESDYARGYRCAVCGMTREQSKAAGYDCATQC